MATGATGQLGLALPVQGELTGSWGNTVNNGITEYTNIAIAATLTLTNDGAVTLANTTGDASASNITSTLTGAGTVTAQFAIVRVTGTLTTAKVVTAPSYSKTYTVVNAATGGIVTFKASGQTGVSIAVGESAFVYFNGTDYVKLAGTATAGAAAGSNTQVQYNSSGALAGSSAFTFDGTTTTTPRLALGGTTLPSAGTATLFSRSSDNNTYLQTGSGNTFYTLDGSQNTMYSVSPTSHLWAISNSTKMTLDSAGNLGLGTTPSAWGAGTSVIDLNTGGSAGAVSSSGTLSIANNGFFNGTNWIYKNTNTALTYQQILGEHRWNIAPSGTAGNTISFTQAMTLDVSGNLGVGTTSPAARIQSAVSRTSGTNTTALVLSDNVTGAQTSGFGTQIRGLSNNGAAVSAIGFEASGGTNNDTAIAFYTQATAGSLLRRAIVNRTGQMGLGDFAPFENWGNGYVSFQVQSLARTLAATGAGSGDLTLAFNAIYDSSDNRWEFASTGDKAGRYSQTGNGDHIFYVTSANGVTGSPITFTQAVTISNSGGLSVGTTADPGAGAIYATGNITAYYSDARLKTVSGKIENALDKVAQLSGVYYTNNSVAKSFGYDSDEVQVGVLAQDVEAVLPQIVKAAPFDLDENGNSKSGENYKTVQYERLVPLLIEAINELRAEVKALESK